jgi:hypothetical protein
MGKCCDYHVHEIVPKDDNLQIVFHDSGERCEDARGYITPIYHSNEFMAKCKTCGVTFVNPSHYVKYKVRWGLLSNPHEEYCIYVSDCR